jgi:hypothetical protein
LRVAAARRPNSSRNSPQKRRTDEAIEVYRGVWHQAAESPGGRERPAEADAILDNAALTSVRQQARQPDDEELRKRPKALANEYRWFGYRRLHVPLRREGHAINNKHPAPILREAPDRTPAGGCERTMGTRQPSVLTLVDRR